MGNKLFGIDIAGIVAKKIGPGLADARLELITQGVRNPANLAAGKPKTSRFADAKGFWEDFTPAQIDGQQVLIDDRKAVLIGDTSPEIANLKRNDKITIEGKTLHVIRILSRDPAAAVYKIHCGDRRGPDGQ